MPSPAARAVALALAAALPACAADALAPCRHDEPDAATPRDLGPLPPVCRNVYVVDTDRRLSAFDPERRAFDDIGVLDCPAAPDDQPFSMAVARDDTAWVLYQSGNLFLVDIKTAACRPSGFVPGQQGFTTFGMGFTADLPGGDAETLYIAGGDPLRLGQIDRPRRQVIPIAPIVGMPELTGNANGELWGFFPSTNDTFVARLDKTTAARREMFKLPRIVGQPLDWAFAYWGGDFWIFLQRVNDSATHVYRLTRDFTVFETALGNTGRHIVGAGVSSCAPVGPVGLDR